MTDTRRLCNLAFSSQAVTDILSTLHPVTSNKHLRTSSLQNTLALRSNADRDSSHDVPPRHRQPPSTKAYVAGIFDPPCTACFILGEACMLSTGFPSCQYCLRTRRYCKRNPLYDWDKLSSVQNPIGGRNDPGAYRASPYSDPLVFSEILAPARILQSAAHSISSEPRDFPTTRPELSTHANPNSDLHLQNTLHQDKNEQTSEFAMPKGRAREVNLDRTSDTTPQSTAAKVTGCDKCIREGKQCISAANNIERQGQCTNCQKAGKTVECSRYQLSTFACLHCHRRHYTCRTERGFKRCVLCEKKGHACVEGTRKQADTIWVFAKNEASRNNTTQDEEFSKIVFDPTRRLTYDIDDLDSNLGTSPMAAPPNKKRKQNNGQTSNSMAGPSLPKAAQRPAQVRNLAAMNNESDDTIADPRKLLPPLCARAPSITVQA